MNKEILGEVAVVELLGRKWTIRFDGSATITLNGIGVILSCEDGDTMSFSLKLEFPCSNNASEYEAYLTRLSTTLGIGIKHMRVIKDSNLVVS